MIIETNTILNSENKKASSPHTLALNTADKMDSKRVDTNVALLNLLYMEEYKKVV